MVSVIIPTRNRPELLKRAVASVHAQTYKDIELIVIEDTDGKGGGWARNQGIAKASGQYVAFLDDDDEWLPNKLEIQMKALTAASTDVAFSFTAVRNIFDDHEENTRVPAGIDSYHELALSRFKTFLNVTLLVKKSVIDEVGYFDERFPSHQEADLVIRLTKKYRGVGINESLVRVTMKSGREHVGGSFQRRIKGREMSLEKYKDEYAARPSVLAYHYFYLGLWNRNDENRKQSRLYFWRAWKADHKLRYLAHWARALAGGFLKNLVALGFGCVVAFIILEIALRILNPFGFRLRGDIIELPRNKKLIINNTRLEGVDSTVIHTTNSLGFRGAEPPEDFDNHLTIVAVGGSTTECYYLTDGKTWTDILGDDLKADFPDIWINNAGLDGHSTFGHEILLQDYLVKLKPKMILFLVGVNDIGRSDLTSFETVTIKQGLQFSSGKAFIKSAANYSEVVSTALNLYRSLLAQKINVGHHQLHLDTTPMLAMSRQEVAAALSAQEQYLAGYKNRLEKLVSTARDNGIEPVFVTQPLLYGFGKDPQTNIDLAQIKVADNLNGSTAWGEMELYNDVTRSVGAQEHVHVVDLAKAMTKNSKYYYDFMHFTNEGAREVGDILSRDLGTYLKEE